MHFRFSRGLLSRCLFFLAAAASLPAEPAAGDEGEAGRLYRRANDYVNAVQEGGYSYSYLQFYWKRAQGNIDRILRVYPATEVGRQLEKSQLRLGPFPVAYFRERVLPYVETKRLASEDAVNCAIFLGEVKGTVWDATRRAATLRIIEVLARQKRWNEALRFNNILPADRPLKTETVFRVAARFEQADLVKDLLVVTPQADLPRYHAILAEALALRGLPRPQIADLVAADPGAEVRLGALRGMIAREVQIRRTAALRLPLNTIILAGDGLKRPEVRDDVAAAAKGFFPEGSAAAASLLAGYRAALGEKPARDATAETRVAYVEHLAAFEKYDEIEAYLNSRQGSAEDLGPLRLAQIEALAAGGHRAEAEAVVTAFGAAGTAAHDEAVLARFRGEMRSTEIPLVVHQETFAALPLSDPSVLAEAMMEWSLTINRSVRGASPYDAVVTKFAPGFANLQPPKSAAVQEAASVQKPY